MFIDTHCHLTDRLCGGNSVANVIQRAMNAGVDTIICPTAAPEDISDAINIANTHNNVFLTIGIHPEYAGINAREYLTNTILQHPKLLGIGEIGLDYHTNTDNRKQQIELFEQQLDIAKQYNLPVAIHTRDADQDTAHILNGDVRGVMHCFTSSWELARVMLNRGFYFSASGILTFKNADEIRDTFRKIPNDRIVIETDSPYCAPVPHRGTPCEPAFVVDTARVLAEIKGLTLTELEPMLRRNTQTLYPRMPII